MPFIDGESLRERLNRERQLPLEDALRITREAADALDHAHQHGVIHRDIKPENILLTGTVARLVADFGIARALDAARDEQLTETGLALGTPAYMSPEQAAGERSSTPAATSTRSARALRDARGRAAVRPAPTAQAMIARRFTEPRRPLRQLRDTVPERVEQAVQQALARAPADRFATAAEFARALEPADRRRHGRTTTRHSAVTAARRVAHRRRAPARRRYPRRVRWCWGSSSASGSCSPGGGTTMLRRTADAGSGRRLAVLPFENLGKPRTNTSPTASPTRSAESSPRCPASGHRARQLGPIQADAQVAAEIAPGAGGASIS